MRCDTSRSVVQKNCARRGYSTGVIVRFAENREVLIGRNSRLLQAFWITASETPKMARRFDVLHRRNHFEEVPEAPDCESNTPFETRRLETVAPVLRVVPHTATSSTGVLSNTKLYFRSSAGGVNDYCDLWDFIVEQRASIFERSGTTKKKRLRIRLGAQPYGPALSEAEGRFS